MAEPGDAYSASRGQHGKRGLGNSEKQNSNIASQVSINLDYDLPPKNLMGQPWRVAFALQDDGWILRSAIVWHKSNPMPESATDRPTSSYEMVFMLVKQGRYFYDAEAVREIGPANGRKVQPYQNGAKNIGHENRRTAGLASGMVVNGANARNVWAFPTQGRPDAHFATFPDELPRRCILAGTSEHGVCSECGAPWAREVEKSELREDPQRQNRSVRNVGNLPMGADGYSKDGGTLGMVSDTQTLGWQPTCDHGADTVPATVLDPFVGSGTTVAIAQSLGRRGVGLDLNSEYLENAAKRIEAVTLPLIAKGELL